MREKFNQFMTGRYGVDQLSRVTNGVAFVLVILGLFWPSLSLFALLMIGLTIFRMFSRNISQRREENATYLRLVGRAKHWIDVRKQRFAQRNVYRYYRCPNCGQDLRVPRGLGNVTMHCPKCKSSFVKKS